MYIYSSSTLSISSIRSFLMATASSIISSVYSLRHSLVDEVKSRISTQRFSPSKSSIMSPISSKGSSGSSGSTAGFSVGFSVGFAVGFEVGFSVFCSVGLRPVSSSSSLSSGASISYTSSKLHPSAPISITKTSASANIRSKVEVFIYPPYLS